jgi:hypothetical protein
MDSNLNLTRRDKSSSHVREPGRIYQAVVTAVRDDGRVSIKIPMLGLDAGPIMPLDTTPSKRLSINDAVSCMFSDMYNSSLIIIGTSTQKADQYAPFESGVTRYQNQAARNATEVSPSEGRVVYLLDTDELQIYNGTEWITVIDTGNSENITVSTLTVLGSSFLSASTTIGTITPTELSYLDGVTSGIQAQINLKAPSASPTFTGTVVLPNNTVTSEMIADGAVPQAKLASSLSAVTVTTSSLLSTAIPSPFNGQVAYETDTRHTKVYDGSAWRFVSFASQYKVGDTGPGGGTIFYVDRFNEYSDFNYLEIAPDSTRVLRTWAQSAPTNYQSTAVSGAGRFALGTGSLNTAEIVAQGNSNPATCAATYCDSLVSGGQSDWYLGSLAEMKLANEVLHQSFSTSWYSGYYWTSTQENTYTPTTSAFYMQALPIGNLNVGSKSGSIEVRAIRKFS